MSKRSMVQGLQGEPQLALRLGSVLGRDTGDLRRPLQNLGIRCFFIKIHVRPDLKVRSIDS